MKKSITKTAIRFIKSIKGNKTFWAITEYLKTKGCTVTFFSESERELLADKHDLERRIMKKDAFTVLEDDIICIYIISESSPEDKLYLLLHEVGHIELKHLEKSVLICNTRLQDIEADTFAYTVLNPPKKNILLTITFVLIAILSFTLGFHSAPKVVPISSVPYEQEYEHTQEFTGETEIEQTNESEYVYITPTGKKYHRIDCRYVKGKDCTELITDEAEKNYEPCSVCKP